MKTSVKKNTLAAALTLIMFLFVCPAVFGTPINSGTYLFTMDGNDANTDLDDIFNAITSSDDYTGTTSFDLAFYAKDDESNGSPLSLTYDDYNESGTWNTESNPIDFYAVKAGNQFAFYWVDPSEPSGIWSTEDLTVGDDRQPGLSHFSAYQITTDTPNPVPEPATMLLMGFGMLCLAGIGRKKLAKKN